MSLFRSWLASLAVAVILAAQANAQCYTWPIPRAPDMCGPGYYYWNCQGYLYGPYHNVYPPFPPHNGFIPGPSAQGGAQGQAGNQHFAAAMQAYQKRGMMPGYSVLQQQQMPPQQPGGYPGFWSHPAVRSPRDFFMYGEDPASSPYRYGGAGGSPSTTDRVAPR
jgi:hypothetical protein